MRINLQFVVNCTQCPRNDVYNGHLVFPDVRYYEMKVSDAEAYFESKGWLRLPSGSYVCSNVQTAQAKEVSA